MISRGQVRQFLAVVDAGNFSRAAFRINVAQPTLSAGIAELERKLGARLFIRDKRHVRLTEAGNRFLPFARSIEGDFDAAETSVANTPSRRRPIRLGVLHSIPTAYLEAAMLRYAGEEPIEVGEGDDSELLAALHNGSIDLALTVVQANEVRFCRHVLFEEPYLLALPLHHRFAARAAVAVADVADDVMIARRSCEFLAETSRFFTSHGVRPRFSMRSARDDRVMAMVRAGLGITVAPRSFCTAGVVMVPIEGFDAKRSVGLLFGADRLVDDAPGHSLPAAFAWAASFLGESVGKHV